MKSKTHKSNKDCLPAIFRPLLWWLKWPDIDIEEDKNDIIFSAVNEGMLEHWRWIINTYGKDEICRVLKKRLDTEFHPESRNLAQIIFSLGQLRHVRKELSSNLLRQVKRTFPEYATSVTYQAPEQLNVLINNIKTTFFQYEYGVIDNFVKYKNVSMASIREIAAMKAFSIGKRLAYKDYVDWYFLLKDRRVDLQDIIEHAKKKFGGDFNDRLFLGQLVSFEDVPTQKIYFFDKEISRETITDFLKETVRTFQF